MIANVSLAPHLDDAVRLFDATLIFLALVWLVMLFTRGLALNTLVISALLGSYLFACYAVWGAVGGGENDGDHALIFSASRQALVLLALPALAGVLRDKDAIHTMLIGGVLGGILVTLLALTQHFGGGNPLDVFASHSAETWWVPSGAVRAVGIWHHPNELAQAQVIAASMALGLTFKRGWVWPGLLLFITLIAGLYIATQTRAALFGAGFGVAIVFALNRHADLRTGIILGGFLALALALAFLSEASFARWSGLYDASSTLAQSGLVRLQTIEQSMAGILTNPLGLGHQGRIDYLSQHAPALASHNGFLAFGLTYGLLPLALVLALTAGAVLAPTPAPLRLVIATTAFMALAEDSLFSPTVFMALAGFGLLCLFAKSTAHRASQPKHQGVKMQQESLLSHR